MGVTSPSYGGSALARAKHRQIETRQLKSGKSYRVIYYEHGKKRRSSAFKTLAEAVKWRDTELPQLQGRAPTDLAGATVSQFHAAWERDLEGLKPATQYKWKRAWQMHVEPRWGHIPVADIEGAQVQAWVNGDLAQFSTTFIKDLVGILRGHLQPAIEAEVIATDPTAGVRYPRRAVRDAGLTVLTPAQVDLLLEKVANRRDAAAGHYVELVTLLVTTGLRWGEAAALTWSDVGSTTITVTKTVSKDADGTRVISQTPKTASAARQVAVPKSLVAQLEARRGLPSALVYESPRGGGVLPEPSSAHSWWNTSVAEAQAADPTFPKQLTRHDLRHTAASLMLSRGCTVLQVQHQLGHADAATTLRIYSHLMLGDLERVREVMDNFVPTSFS